jgi:FkbH-like protein
MVEVIRELDQRGILHSVASKNDHDEAMGAIKRFGLEDYFLFPQVSWQPKSTSIKAIASALNIGIDSLLFVDDSQFELQEVQTACPGVRVLPAARYRELPGMDACKASVTAESRSRRKLYQVETSRRAVAETFGQDYLSFLRHCDIRISISALCEENLERAHELATRTNQMNFSGNRYDRDVLRKVMDTPHLDTYVIACEDRFGSYGVVGFSVVDRREPRMTDLMFSCRIQSKRVEHAFLAFLIRKYFRETDKDFLASYRQTERNAPSGRVFADLEMQEVETVDGVSLLRFPRSQVPPDDGIIRVEMVDGATIAG